jgi:hypothetical protein
MSKIIRPSAKSSRQFTILRSKSWAAFVLQKRAKYRYENGLKTNRETQKLRHLRLLLDGD